MLLGLGIGLLGCRPGGPPANAESEGPKAVEAKTANKAVMDLVGTLRRPASAKHAYRLEIYPAGNLKVIEMLGEALKKIPDKTPVLVRGVVRSQIVGPAKDDPDQYPVQWGVWLRVSEAQTFATLEEAFAAARERQAGERE